jgi:hypothetical protein
MRPIKFIKKCWRCPSGKFAWQVVDSYGAIYASGKEDTRGKADAQADVKKREQIRKALKEMPAEVERDPAESRRRYKHTTHSLFTPHNRKDTHV